MSASDATGSAASAPPPPAPGAAAALRRLGGALAAPGKSTMRLNPFGLFTARTVGIEEGPGGELFNVTHYAHAPSGLALPGPVRERRESARTTARELRAAAADGIDNTGNFHWPAEEVLAHLLLTPGAVLPPPPPPPPAAVEGADASAPRLPTVRVVELGAGVGLAGFCVAARYGAAAHVTVTDGNATVVETLSHNAQRLRDAAAATAASDDAAPRLGELAVGQLLWHAPTEGMLAALGAATHVVAADCLFFDKFHAQLKALLLRCLRREGDAPPPVVTMVAPRRGTTLQRFVDTMAAEPDVVATVDECYDDGIAATHRRLLAEKQTLLAAGDDAPSAGGAGGGTMAAEYEPDRHYPLLLRFTRKVV